MNKTENRTYKWYRDIIAETGERNNFKGFEYVMLLPDLFYLLCKLMADKSVSKRLKRTIAVAVLYLISPINIVPNIIPGLGLLDDVAICVYALNKIINDTDMEIINKYWCGSGDLMNIISSFIEKADNFIGAGMLKKVKNMFS